VSLLNRRLMIFLMVNIFTGCLAPTTEKCKKVPFFIFRRTVYYFSAK
jgi:hypothetical protein